MNILESLLHQKNFLETEVASAQDHLDAARVEFDESDKKVRELRHQLRQISIAVTALERSANGAGAAESESDGRASPFHRRRRNIREMVRSALEHADHPMNERELMQAVEATKISVGQALSHLMMHGQAIPLTDGWVLKNKEPEYAVDDDEEEDAAVEKEVERERMYE